MTTHVLIEPEYQAALAQAGLLDFDAMMSRAGEGPPASVHRHRETVRLGLSVGGERRTLFLKRVFRVPWQHAWEDWRRLRPAHSQPWREWLVMARLTAAAVPVPRRVAMGERRSAGRAVAAFVLMEAAPMRHTLADWLPPRGARAAELSTAQRTALWAGLGGLFGRLCAAGLVWPDASPGHVFAEPMDERRLEWRFCLIDVERVRESTERLASRAEAAFWRRCLPFEPGAAEYAALAGTRRAATSTARSSGRGGVHFGAVDPVPICAPSDGGATHGMQGGAGFWMNEFDAPLLGAHRLNSAARLLDYQGGQSLSKPGLAGHRRRARVELPTDSGRMTYYLKQIVRPPWREQWRRMRFAPWRDSTAWREWHFIRRLTEIGVPTMRCAAVAEEMRGIVERCSAILTAEVPGEALERWWPTHGPALSRRARNALVAQVAAVTRLMHAADLFHRDLYLSHLFVSWIAPDAPVIHVIDVARMLERPACAEHYRIKDLAALHYSAPSPQISRTDRWRFLRWYAAGPLAAGKVRTDRAALRELARRVVARAERMRRHDRKAGRA